MKVLFTSGDSLDALREVGHIEEDAPFIAKPYGRFREAPRSVSGEDAVPHEAWTCTVRFSGPSTRWMTATAP